MAPSQSNWTAHVTPLLALTIFHTALSIIALLLGLLVVGALLAGRNREQLTGWFLVTALVTTLTGFLFPFHGITPAIGVGLVSCLALAAAFIARNAGVRKRGWRAVSIVALLLSEYFLVFVGIVQAFLKVPSLHELAPTGMETPFKVAQGLLLTVFVVVTIIAVRARPRAMSATLRPAR
jgi:hypothetical protein